MTSTRIQNLFQRLAQERRLGLVAYLTAGDPSPERTPALVAALERGGADLIELGVPFSDPVADGPVIQRGAERALRAGTSLRKVLDIAARVRQSSRIPLILFTYLNPALRYGFERLAADAAACGVDGCLLTDLSVEEAEGYVRAMRSSGLDTVFLAAPTSTPRRLQLVARYSTGFVYLVSRTGVTGEQESLSDAVRPLAAAVRSLSRLPRAVGFGISRPDHVAALRGIAEAVVVGSAFVRLVEQYASAKEGELEKRLEMLARELSAAGRLAAAEKAI